MEKFSISRGEKTYNGHGRQAGRQTGGQVAKPRYRREYERESESARAAIRTHGI